MHTLAERAFRWESRFRSSVGVGITLPTRRSSGSVSSVYGSASSVYSSGSGFGEDIQLIDLIEAYANSGVGKRPRLLSFHIPLHRTLSYAILEACKYPHLIVCIRSLQAYMIEYSEKNAVSLSSSIDIPLLCVLFGTQVGLSMWSRNGQCVIDQVMNYADYPYCRIYKELDTLLIQFLLTIHPPDQFISQLFYRFGVAEYVAHRKSVNSSVMYDEPYLNSLLDESMKYIVNLVTELPVGPIDTSIGNNSGSKGSGSGSSVSGTKNDSNTTDTNATNTANTTEFAYDIHAHAKSARLLPLLRRELLHKLVSGPCTYSQLHECISAYPDASKINTTSIDSIVQELTIRNDNNYTSAPTYTLKKELYSEYDPCFPRIAGSVHQKVFEDRPKVTRTMAIISRPFVPHVCFGSVRCNVLLAPVLLRVQVG